MAGLTAPPDNAAAPDGPIIAADDWFPGIDTDAVRAKVRIGDGAVTDERLAEAVTAGILAGLDALADWQNRHREAGVVDLVSVTTRTVAGENLATLLWGRVVMFYAAAELMDGHTDVAATDDALDREEEKRVTADMYRRKAYEAVADLLKIGAAEGSPIGRNWVELI